MKIIGLTGSIASGKTTVSNIIQQAGYQVICADTLAKQAVAIGTEPYKKIIEIFGNQILQKDQNINREQLAEIIFNNPKKREQLNQIVHPWVINQTNKLITQYQNQNQPIIFLDVPLLFETKMNSLCDKVIVVDTPEKTILTRLTQRNQLSLDQANKRLNSQMPLVQKKQLADYIIDNSGTIKQTEKNVVNVLKIIQAE